MRKMWNLVKRIFYIAPGFKPVDRRKKLCWKICLNGCNPKSRWKSKFLIISAPYFATYQRALCNSSGIVTKPVPVNNCRPENFSSNQHKETKYHCLEACRKGSSPTYSTLVSVYINILLSRPDITRDQGRNSLRSNKVVRKMRGSWDWHYW